MINSTSCFVLSFLFLFSVFICNPQLVGSPETMGNLRVQPTRRVDWTKRGLLGPINEIKLSKKKTTDTSIRTFFLFSFFYLLET